MVGPGAAWLRTAPGLARRRPTPPKELLAIADQPVSENPQHPQQKLLVARSQERTDHERRDEPGDHECQGQRSARHGDGGRPR